MSKVIRKLPFWHKGRNENNHGSLTVEACIALPVFLCFFFLLLFFVKIACLNIEIDHAVKETARRLAACTYPLNYVNDYVDNNVEKKEILENFLPQEKKKIKDTTGKTLKKSLLTTILTGEFSPPDLEKSMEDICSSINGDLISGYEGMAWQFLLPVAVELKEIGQDQLVRWILSDYLSDSIVNQERLRVTLADLPQAHAEYQYKKDTSWYQGTGLQPDADFSSDDVVIQVEYAFAIPLPFFGQREILLRHTAVEKAWLKGANGIYTADKAQEQIDLKDLVSSPKSKEKSEEDREVYVCKSNTAVYHTRSDCDYLGGQYTIMTVKEAHALNKRAHKGCPYRFK
ncbi:MAG: hypothetical protein ACOX2X_06045 [Peptococcia bacterium]|jgi:hypothetical protein